MAWDYTISNVNSGQMLTENYDCPAILSYNSYYVLKAKITADVDTVSLNMVKIQNTADGVAYICASQQDFIGSEEQPYSYFATMRSNQGWITFDRTYFGTYLYIVIRAHDLQAHGDFVRVYFEVDSSSSDSSIFTAVGDNNTKMIEVNVITQFNNIQYTYCLYNEDLTLIEESSYTTNTQYFFSGLSNGIYYVRVRNRSSGRYVETTNGEVEIEITISGDSPPPQGNYNYNITYSTNVSQASSLESGYLSSQYNGFLFSFYFNVAGTLRVYSSYQSGTLKSYEYIGSSDPGYNSENGQPYSYSDYAAGAFDFTQAGIVGQTFFLWINSNNNNFSFDLNISFTPSGGEWDYSLDNNYTITATRSISESVSSYNGKRFRVQFSYDCQATFQITSGSGYIYITEAYYGWNPNTGAPYSNNSQTQEAVGRTSFTQTVTSSHGYYTIWVRGATGSYSGTITVTITPSIAPVVNTGYVYIYTSQGWKKAKPYIYTGSGSNQGWKPASAYIFNGSTWKITKE